MEVGLLAGIDAVAILEDRHVIDGVVLIGEISQCEAILDGVRDANPGVDHAELLGGRKRGTGCCGRSDGGLDVQRHL